MNFKSIFKGLAAISLAVMAIVSCKPAAQEYDAISVDPSSALSFEATGNEDVILNVTTNVKEWTYTAPEWIVATKEGEILKVNVTDNTTSEPRIGRIVFNAGIAEPVKINVFQDVAGASAPVSGVAVKLNNKLGSTALSFKSETETTLKVSVSIDAAATEDVQVELIVDEEYIKEFNFLNNRVAELYPVAGITLPEDAVVTIPAGQTESAELEVKVNLTMVNPGATEYLVPLYLKAVSNATVKQSTCRVNYTIMKVNPREVKNIVYIEVNDCNPLNLLEYNLEDGSPFFDAVILFAANINYNATEDVVYLKNNPNVQALLDESDVYIQPLRARGIKVYLGLLGNHDAAGLAQLSRWGSEQWAQEVAMTCKTYGLDGVNIDDEYSSSPDLSNAWFTNPSCQAGSYLMYQLKKAMAEHCPWPTEVSLFEWGSMWEVEPIVDDEGVTHNPSEFVDITMANYGSAASPYADLTMKECSGQSIQLNYGNSISESSANSIKEAGYGWIMWFAFDPSGTGGISSNRTHSLQQFRNVSNAIYGQNVVDPQFVYNKIGEGKYDPTPHAIN